MSKKNDEPKLGSEGESLSKKAIICTCSGAGGFLSAHFGCVATPALVWGASTVGLTFANNPLTMAFTSAMATGAGLFAWYKLRGNKSSKVEKTLVIGSALTALVAYSSFGMDGHEGHMMHEHGDRRSAEEIINSSMCTTEEKTKLKLTY